MILHCLLSERLSMFSFPRLYILRLTKSIKKKRERKVQSYSYKCMYVFWFPHDSHSWEYSNSTLLVVCTGLEPVPSDTFSSLILPYYTNRPSLKRHMRRCMCHMSIISMYLSGNGQARTANYWLQYTLPYGHLWPIKLHSRISAQMRLLINRVSKSILSLFSYID